MIRGGPRSEKMIRAATIYDVPRIQEIINSHAELGRMLFKSLAQLFESLRDFAVYEDEETGRVVGCCALTIIWADLAEVRSLATMTSSPASFRYRSRTLPVCRWIRPGTCTGWGFSTNPLKICP